MFSGRNFLNIFILLLLEKHESRDNHFRFHLLGPPSRAFRYFQLFDGQCLFACIYVVYKSYIGIIMTMMLFVSIILIFSLFSIPQTRLFVIKKSPSTIVNFLEGSMTGLRTIAYKGKRNIFIVFCLTFLRLIVYGLGLWVSLWGLEILAPIVYSFLVIVIAQFTTLIPVSIMGFGPVEAVCVLSFEQINIEISKTIFFLTWY